MQSKNDRHRAILETVSGGPLATQAELSEALRRRGIRVDQATLSRDLRELGLVKIASAGGGYRYAAVDSLAPISHAPVRSLITRLVRSIDTSGNLIVLKTDPGAASPLGVAIDRLGWRDLVGTVAGDDTLLVVVRQGVPAKRVVRKLQELPRLKGAI